MSRTRSAIFPVAGLGLGARLVCSGAESMIRSGFNERFEDDRFLERVVAEFSSELSGTLFDSDET